MKLFFNFYFARIVFIIRVRVYIHIIYIKYTHPRARTCERADTLTIMYVFMHLWGWVYRYIQICIPTRSADKIFESIINIIYVKTKHFHTRCLNYYLHLQHHHVVTSSPKNLTTRLLAYELRTAGADALALCRRLKKYIRSVK
jgi:hypothetical protein